MKKRRVIGLHPSLGYGGAERVFLQILEALVGDGWDAEAIVAENPQRIALPSGVIVRTTNSPWPTTVIGRFRSWLTYLRLRPSVAMAVAQKPDLIIVDLLPHLIPLIKDLAPDVPVLAYCHFPDALLAPTGSSKLYCWHRKRFNTLEQAGLAQADRILVNSEFTAVALHENVLQDTVPEVVYPGIESGPTPVYNPAERDVILSLGRIRSEKNHALAIESFAQLPAGDYRLVIAGGMDANDAESCTEHQRLTRYIAQSGTSDRIELCLNATDDAIAALWARTRILVHPAPCEHFGLVPIEAMTRAIPVVAVNHGGPREIIIPGKTGQLVSADASSLAEALHALLDNSDACRQLGQAGRARVEKHFTLARFQARMRTVADELTNAC